MPDALESLATPVTECYFYVLEPDEISLPYDGRHKSVKRVYFCMQ
jgi:hypothetical protein